MSTTNNDTGGLTFNTLRAANKARLPQFKNKHGALAHSQPDGSDWSPAQWLQAVIGELGEYANIRKKFERGDLSWEEFREAASKELECASAFQFLATFYALPKDKQEELVTTIQQMGAAAALEKKNA